MNISDEAVEAAHEAWREQARQPGTIFEYNLRAALEAAAPHLMAEALDESADELRKLNPPYGNWLHARAESYRSAGAGE
jgi:hypothetical protein